MLKYEIPNNIKFKLYQKSNDKILKCENSITFTWFKFNDESIKINDRIVYGNKKTIKLLKKAVKTLLLGYKRSLIIVGVGYRWWIENNSIYIKVSNTKPLIFNIPNDIAIKIDRNNLYAWSYNVSIIDHFFNKILNKTPNSKNYIKKI